MGHEDMDQVRKRHYEPHHSRRDQENRRNAHSETRPKHSRSDHHVQNSEPSRHKKNDRQKLASSVVKSVRDDRGKRDSRESLLVHRPGFAHRNSPIELVNRGCRNTDSSSSSSSTDDTDGQNANYKKNDQSQSRKRTRQEEESFKALSDRKKKIESELRALDAEEAAQRKKPNRDHSNHHQDKRNHSPVRSVRVKKEPVTDDESSYRKRRNHSEKRPVQVKRELSSDDDRNNRSQAIHKAGHSARIKQERVNSSTTHSQRLHRPGVNHKRQNVNAMSRSDADNMEWGKPEHEKPEKKDIKEKEKPNFETSGKLAEDTNTFNGVVIKYNEPAEARKPRRKWRLYPFKGDDSLPFIPVHRQSAYLLGRSRLIADIPVDHPSCSKQHAVLQFRLTPYTKEDGKKGRSVRPYIIDLDSSNGTYLNNNRIDPRRYTELCEKDVLKFGFSSRVYVMLHEDSKNADENDEGVDKTPP